MEKSFYQATSPEEAIEIYTQSDSELYGQMKNRVIGEILNELFRISWNCLKVLEVGAGGGNWTQCFIQRGAEVTCVDTCKQILEGNKKLHPEARFILGDASSIQIDETFDLVFAKDVIEHIAEDERFLRNMNRHLRDSGSMIINTQNCWSFNYFIQGSYHLIRGDHRWRGWDPTHVRFYNHKSLSKKLEKNGFKIKKWFGSYYFPYKIISGRLDCKKLEWKIFHFIELLKLYDIYPFSIVGWNIGVVCEKIRAI